MENLLHEKAFQFCEEYRKTNPDFRYWLRVRNDNNRLDNGMWFQGNEKYAFVGICNRDSGNLSTKSFGLVFREKDGVISADIEIIFKREKEPKIIAFYNEAMEMIGGFNKKSQTHYRKVLDTGDAFSSAKQFLDTYKKDLDGLIIKHQIEHIFFSEISFKEKLNNIMRYRTQMGSEPTINYIIVNITWNSKDWTSQTTDKSTHSYVVEGGTPHESWNFDFDNPRNTDEIIYGFSQFTHPPKVSGSNNLIIFSSQNQIVGFYGQAEVLARPYDESLDAEKNFNLAGKKALSLCLGNKISNLKEKGYLEDNKRIGQIGFSYLRRKNTIINMLDEAIELNPNQAEKLSTIKNWVTTQDKKSDEINYWVFQANPKVYNIVEALRDGVVKSWSVKAHKNKIKIGDKVILWKVGEIPGCYALCRIASKLRNRKDDEIEKKYYTDISKFEPIDRVDIVVEVTLWDRPILKEQVINLPEFKDFKAGRQGTNFSATKTQYEAIQNLINMGTQEKNELNLILFGPPGTGKTYHTINEAVRIISPKFYIENNNAENRKALRDEFNRLLIKNWDDPKGQIAFCTFHQSFSYEDFVEGIKPKAIDGNISYDIRPGVFKRICDLAESNYSAIKVIKEGKLSWKKDDFRKASFYKLSLGNSTIKEDAEIYEYCRDNNCIAIGFGDDNDFSGLSESEIREKSKELDLESIADQQLVYFIHYIKKGDYVIISEGKKFIRALGKVTGDYRFEDNPAIRYQHFRDVDWLFVDEKIAVEEVYSREFSQKTLYKIDQEGLKEDFFTGKGQKENIEQKEDKRYVLIIDEVNRGNIANIFGELITLIEKDKRAGQDEELEVVLPYSKARFKVPPNLYIIGTMNTADRSIEALDTALRRRFSFTEMPPDTSLIKDAGKLKPTGVINNPDNGQEIDVVRLLDKINERIEKLIDKDHKIGHSYFMNIKNMSELKAAFKDKVIPLMEEYFFGDFGKIGLVLGNSFVERVNHINFDFASFASYNNDGGIEQDLAERPVYRIKKPNEPGAWDFVDVYSHKPLA